MLVYSIIMFLVAALFTVLGIAIYKGKTDLIHDYHQTKVTDKSAYGKAFGKAMLVIAIIMLLSGIIGLFENLTILAVAILIIGLVIGIGFIVVVQKSTIREYSNFQFIELLASPDLKTVGANYLFTAEQSCNIVIYPLRTSRFHVNGFMNCLSPMKLGCY